MEIIDAGKQRISWVIQYVLMTWAGPANLVINFTWSNLAQYFSQLDTYSRNYLFKFNNRNIRKRCKVYPKFSLFIRTTSLNVVLVSLL